MDFVPSKVVCGPAHALIKSSDNDLFVIGNNSTGAIGINQVSTSQAICVELLERNFEIKEMATGPNHSLVLLQSSDSQVLMGCGSNEAGQLGTESFEKFNQLVSIE